MLPPDPNGIPGRKAGLREQVQRMLKQIPPERRRAASAAACEILRGREEWENARSVFFYVPLATEIDLLPLLKEGLKAGKTIAVPRFDSSAGGYEAARIESGESWVRGPMGVREPPPGLPSIPLNQLDLVLVPGLAFDAYGRRLGRGKGFYDRLLTGVEGAKCGVGFDEQLVDEIPVETHDILVNVILTPSRWLSTGLSAAQR